MASAAATYNIITDVGNTALWIGFAFMAFSAVTFLFLSYVRNVKPEARFTYYVTTLINAFAALAYLVMALGQSYYTNPNGGGRQWLWVRYADWIITVPLLVIDLGVLAGAHWVEIFFSVFSSMIMIIAGFAAALSTGYNATWPLFTFGFVAFAPVALNFLTTFRTSAYRHHIEIGKLYDVLAFGSTLLWFVYGIVWACSEGGYKMSVDAEIIVYTVLDITAKCVFGFTLLFSREAIARYGTFLGGINTGITYDFPIPGSLSASSSSSYAVSTTKGIVYGEHRDLAFAGVRSNHAAPAGGASGAAYEERSPLVVPVEIGSKASN